MKALKHIFTAFMMCVGGVALAVQAPNPRDASVRNASRYSDTTSDTNVNQARRATTGVRVRAAQIGRNGTVVSRAAAQKSTRQVRAGTTPTRTVVRSATPSIARSGARMPRATGNVVSGMSGMARSAKARATAVFSDVSKIGSGYAGCRESYSTCMDQLCANANDTYRRCFCSERFTKFRDAEEKLDQAMIMLQQFQDNNLNAVDKSAAEVNAMYTATVGEMAIKRDTSAAGQMLDNITELLSGKSSNSTTGSNSSSLGILDLDFSTNFDDIWSTPTNSLFDTAEKDISSMEGLELFNAAQKQCVRLSQNMCENDAVFKMTQSSYNILIAQDCNAYEKSLNKKKETVAAAVREAEKYLREARLEEYRTHNSADVNQCLDKVRTAIFADTACGENYKRCLDPTGAYIDANGEPIYSPRLFKLEGEITLTGNIDDDVLKKNSKFENHLETYHKYVARELDTCRDIADFVWTEFKRVAIIEIAQAQAEKLEEVRMSCVDTIAECYNSKSESLVNMNKDTATTAGALGRYAARGMCREEVMACAALYTPEGGQACTINSNGHVENANTCGLTSLLNFVDRVDKITIADKCGKALDEHLEKLCTPSGSGKYPDNCLKMDTMDMANSIKKFANSNCSSPTGSEEINNEDELSRLARNKFYDIVDSIQASLAAKCEEKDGFWAQRNFTTEGANTNEVNGGWNPVEQSFPKPSPEPGIEQSFYYDVFGGNETEDWGACYQNTEQLMCNAYNDGQDEELASWNSTKQTCEFKTAWYERQCQKLGNGYFEDGTCYIEQE